MENQFIQQAFHRIADILELEDANQYRVRAYRRAADYIGGFRTDITQLSRQELVDLPTIGEDLADKILEYKYTGEIDFVELLEKQLPKGLRSIMAVPGIGPKMTHKIYHEGGIQSLKELELACKDGRLEALPGIKQKTVANIAQGIDLLKHKNRNRKPIATVLPMAERILERIKAFPETEQASLAGSIRRQRPVVKDIDIVVSTEFPDQLSKKILELKGIDTMLARGDTKLSFIIQEKKIQVDVRLVSPVSYGAALQYFTGSKNHNIALRKIAIDKGFKLNEYGLFVREGGTPVAGKNETDIYEKLGLNWIPPIVREDKGEIEKAVIKS